ncbi:hypothetical protein O9H85_20665 [Paenibacillus filicis]|uniref:Uncharacterized protein n=1 Tax=Paenibacillus gyeongsangnamensis TaxID=3388067 RepID=A0ABT4QD80_9BACL|nr:hypothetical protein [Paenibacillus filicis]MCZ8514790.1 hypothetical protein [Paenibacillus filicis]
MIDKVNGHAVDREHDEAELETYGVAVCQKCGAELPLMAECYPTVCGECGGNTFYPIQPKPRKPDKAAFLPYVGVIDDYIL